MYTTTNQEAHAHLDHEYGGRLANLAHSAQGCKVHRTNALFIEVPIVLPGRELKLDLRPPCVCSTIFLSGIPTALLYVQRLG